MRTLAVRAVITTCAAVIVCAGCSTSNDNGASPQPTPSVTYELILAVHPECQQPGVRIARYLDTGRPTSLDLEYGDHRQKILTLAGERRALAIRQYAAEVIQSCDERLSKEEAAQAAEASAAAAATSAARAEREARRRYREACERLGGRVDSDGCAIDYPQWSEGTSGPAGSTKWTFYIQLDDDGNVVANKDAEDFCTQFKAEGNGDWWHEDTQICAVR